MWRLCNVFPVEFGGGEGLLRHRVGNALECFRFLKFRKAREFIASAFAHCNGQLGCEIAEKWEGLCSPHSSPINSIGIWGSSRQTAAIARTAAAGTNCVTRSPNARLPTWSWFWMNATKTEGGRSALGVPRGRPR